MDTFWEGNRRRIALPIVGAKGDDAGLAAWFVVAPGIFPAPRWT